MRILFLGDVVGKSGCLAVTKNLPEQNKKKKIDFVIVNGENAADQGVGITEKITKDLISSGVDVITTGNHVWDQKETINFIDKENRFIDFESRSQENCNISNENRTSEMSVVLSQGTHSVFHWKNYIAFKSVFDLAIYSMLITELKPNIIIEIGSGKGGSAIWLADMMKILGLEPRVYSYDINKPSINYPGVNFFQFDLLEQLFINS